MCIYVQILSVAMCFVVLSCRRFGLFAELNRFLIVAAKLAFCGLHELNRFVVAAAKLAFCGIERVESFCCRGQIGLFLRN